MTFTDYCLRRLAERGLSTDHVAVALENEIERETQNDGRVRVWGWVAELDKCLRVVVEPDGETVMNAMPDRKCTKAQREARQ